MSENLFVSELSASHHTFSSYHFCRGNNSKRKSRIGVILRGHGSYIYLNKRLEVREGDVVFIPENVYCYSEWHGTPSIDVVYINCFIHYGIGKYDPQLIECGEKTKNDILAIHGMLSESHESNLEAYSLFYRLLADVLPRMKRSETVPDRTLECAISYITNNFNTNFSVSDLARKCCVSESTLYSLFRAKLGQTPIKYINSIRINVAIEYLENSNFSVSTISELVGFNSENHFRRIFRDFTGSTPLKFRKQG